MGQLIIQITLCLTIPALALFLEKRVKWVEYLGPVILCYVVGIAMGNLPFFSVNETVGKTVYEVSAILAVPLVLFSADMKNWIRLAGKTLLSFGFCVVAILISTITAWWLMGDQLPESSQLAGMTVGVYTGGTPNLTAIGVALGVSESLIAQANITDLIVCVPYLVILFTVAQRVLLWFLPPFSSEENSSTESQSTLKKPALSGILISLLLAGACLGLSVGLAEILPIAQKGGLIIVGVTLLGLALSFFRPIREMAGSYETGEYLLLVFCVAIGMMIRFEDLAQGATSLLLFMAIATYGAIAIHYALAAVFKIDADTVIVTSTAAIFSPVFVAPIARVLGNRKIIPSGMTTGVIGFAVGNLVGLGVAYLLENWG